MVNTEKVANRKGKRPEIKIDDRFSYVIDFQTSAASVCCVRKFSTSIQHTQSSAVGCIYKKVFDGISWKCQRHFDLPT